MRRFPIFAPLLLLAGPAAAQIVLSQPSFEAGARYAAFFKVEQGCGESPTVSLRLEMPDGVSVLETPPKPGWTVNAERAKDRIVAVTWQGKLAAKTADQFGLFMKLPDKTGPLYFPAVQRCEKGENRWTNIPSGGQGGRDMPHPAPVLQLTAAAPVPVSTMVMAGDIMLEEMWSRATPPGAATGVAYLTITNHGKSTDTLTGGSSTVGQVQIHQMSMAGGIMSMRPVQGVVIAPGAIVKITPEGGYHLMLVGLKAPLKQGTQISATLNFAKAGAVKVEFPIGAIGARGPAGAKDTMGAMPGMDHDHH